MEDNMGSLIKNFHISLLMKDLTLLNQYINSSTSSLLVDSSSSNNSLKSSTSKPMLPSISSIQPHEDLLMPQRFEEEIDFRVLRIRPIRIRSKGGIKKVYYLVSSCAGNGQGGIGIGQGRGTNVITAIEQSQKRALKNIEYFPMYENRTLFHDQFHKFKSCRLTCWSVPPSKFFLAI